jgi:hypothetical protein
MEKTTTQFIVQEFRPRSKKWVDTSTDRYDTLKEAEKELSLCKTNLKECAWIYGRTFRVNFRILEVSTREFFSESYTAKPKNSKK